MASTGKCPFCGGVVRSDERTCPHCGAENKLYIEDKPRTIHRPRTIDELKEYCAERGMPLLRMRFFIGEDYKEPKAFGIYRDGKNFVVYKNKADGSRAVRYRGPDEAHAVDELFQKLLSECHNRGIYPDGKPVTRSGGTGSRCGSGGQRKSSSSNLSGKQALGILFLMVLWILLLLFSGVKQSRAHRDDGYYSNGNGRVYYHYASDWYYSYDDGSDDWYRSYSSFPESNYQDYRLGKSWDSDWGVSDFTGSSTWDSIRSSESSSSSSDYDSWDSGDTDWDSDW